MASMFHSLETGRRGLAAGQAAIATAGNNIANANTAGYTRQKVNQSETPSLNNWPSGQLGTGVSVDSITRVRDGFLDRQYWTQSGVAGEARAERAAFDGLQDILGDLDGTGLNGAMDQLWSAWQDLANDPGNLAAQAVVKERAQAFTETAQAIDRSFSVLREDLAAQEAEAIRSVNDLAGRIAELNDSIQRSGGRANELLDQRDALTDQLAGLAEIQVTERDGMYHISVMQADGTRMQLVDGDNPPAELTADTPLAGGKLGGLSNALRQTEALQQQTSDIIRQFAEANGGLITGTDSVQDMRVNFGTTNVAVPAGLDEAIQTGRADFSVLISQLGAQANAAIGADANAGGRLQAIDSRRQSVSGVSLDEEMADLIKFQHAYNAAARLISTTDQMLDTIINRMAAR